MACTAPYKCTSLGCYSCNSPETNTLFQKLQTVTNQFAAGAGNPLLKVDGIIGNGTTQAVLNVLIWIGETDQGVVGASARAIEDQINGPEQLTVNAQAVVDTLTLASRSSAVASQATPPAPLPAPSTSPSILQLATTTANSALKATTPAAQQRYGQIMLNPKKSAMTADLSSLVKRLPPWVAYATGGLLIAGAIAAAMSAAKKRKTAAPASTAAVSGRYRYY